MRFCKIFHYSYLLIITSSLMSHHYCIPATVYTCSVHLLLSVVSNITVVQKEKKKLKWVACSSWHPYCSESVVFLIYQSSALLTVDRMYVPKIEFTSSRLTFDHTRVSFPVFSHDSAEFSRTVVNSSSLISASFWFPLPTPPLHRTEDKCVPPEPPENGVLTGEGGPYHPGDVVEVSCVHNYMMEGQSLMVCQEDGKWSNEVPKCKYWNYCWWQ